MAAWGYEFCLLLLKVSLTRSLHSLMRDKHSKIKFISPHSHVTSSISQVLIPAFIERRCSQLDRTILVLPVRLGGLGMRIPCLEADDKYASSVKVTTPLVQQIMSQSHANKYDI